MSDDVKCFGPRVPVTQEMLDDCSPSMMQRITDGVYEWALWAAAGMRRPDMRVNVEAMTFVKRERRPLSVPSPEFDEED